jgi:hypothetical protein
MRHNYSLFFLLLMFVFCGTSLKAQGDGGNHGLFEGGAIGFDLGLNGPGIHISTSLTPNFLVTAGINGLWLDYDSRLNHCVSHAYLPSNPAKDNDFHFEGYISDLNIKHFNFKWLVEYYPNPKGIFSVAAGVFFGKSTVSITGQIEDYGTKEMTVIENGQETIINEYPVFDIIDGAITVKPNLNGSYKGSIIFGNNVRPYIGIGIGRTITSARRNPLGFKAELGLIYMGDFTFAGDNLIVDKEKLKKSETKYFVNSSAFDISNMMFTLNFALSFRLF